MALPDRQMDITKNQSHISNDDWNQAFTGIFSMIFLALVLSGYSYSRGKTTGLPDLECPSSPNCVSTQARDSGHHVSSFPYSGDPDSARNCLKQAILEIPRSRVVEEKSASLRAEFKSRIFRFIDDAEFRLNKTKSMIGFRSSSRAGYYDFGVNRQRIEKLRIEFRKRCNANKK